MPSLVSSLKIQATPDEVWEVLGDLARTPEYVPGIVEVRIEGNQRICTDAKGNEIREEIAYHSGGQRGFHFRHLKSPLPVKSSQGSFTISGEGDQTVVSLEWEFEPLDPEMTAQLAPMLEGAAEMTLDNLSRRVQALAKPAGPN